MADHQLTAADEAHRLEVVRAKPAGTAAGTSFCTEAGTSCFLQRLGPAADYALVNTDISGERIGLTNQRWKEPEVYRKASGVLVSARYQAPLYES